MPLCKKHKINFGEHYPCPICSAYLIPQGSVKKSPGVTAPQKPDTTKGALTALVQKEVSRG